MQLRRIKEVFKFTQLYIDIGVYKHTLHCVEQRFNRYHLGMRAHDNDRGELDGLIDNDLDRMRPRACHKINLFARMMRLMRPPQNLARVLPAVKKINIQVVCYQEKQNLFGYGPAFKKGKTRPMQK